MPLPASPNGALLSAFEQHYAELVRYIARRTGSMEEARGLAHDTWLRIAERDVGSEGALEDPRAYLFTISHNLAMNHLRRGSWMQGYLAECGQAEQALPAQAPDVADGMMYRQAIVHVEAVLQVLPERVREAYLAHGLHGEKQADIAARLGVSIDTIKRDIAQATRSIETAMHAWRRTPVAALAPQAAQPPSAGTEGADSVRRSRRKSLLSLLGIGSMVAGGGVIWQLLQRQALRYETVLATLRGQRMHHELPDGSVLTLDALSRMELDFTAERRLARLLEGAAFFAVQHDVQRPFVVQARGVQVTVLGTRFGVEIDGGDGVQVQVESGRVQVEALGQRHVLTAGQGLHVGRHEVSLTQQGHAAAWREGRLDFDAVPLGEALARVARYAPMALQASPAAAQLPISGTVHVARAQEWLAALPSVLPVRVRREADGSIDIAQR